MAAPLFTYTANFFLKLDVNRPAFKAQALYAADAVDHDAALPAAVRAYTGPLRTAAGAFNEKLVASTVANEEENFGDVRGEADVLIRLHLRRFIGPRYEEGSDGYKRFLPQDLGEYNDADEQRYEVIFERYVLAMEAETPPFKSADDPTAVPAADARALLTRLQGAATTDTEFESGQNRTSRALTADWRTVAIAEWRLWLKLQDHFADDADYRKRVYGYFDFSQVHTRGAAPDDTAPVVPPVAP